MKLNTFIINNDLNLNMNYFFLIMSLNNNILSNTIAVISMNMNNI